jgi:hypothetical protein
MAAPILNINDVSQAIQLALGPVFLLTGIAATLNVMTGRLSRIIDRARSLSESDTLPLKLSEDAVHREMHALDKRRYLASAAITASTLSALLICLVIVVLFLEVVLVISLKWLVGIFFTSGTVSLVVGLSYFLREVRLATKTIRFVRVKGAAQESVRSVNQ